MADSSDRNLLFGILALQMDFISREQLVAGMQAWVLAKEVPLAEHLAAAGSLRLEHRQLLEPLVEAHIRQHGNDPEQSLASISSLDALRSELAELKDDLLDATIAHIPVGHKSTNDADRYAACSVGAASSQGMRFRILRPHAEGGLGRVSVALDSELGREVALKEIKPKWADDPDSRGRFTREAEITGGLEHPGIVPVYGLGAYPDGRPFYAMRFIRGNSLKDAIDRFHERRMASEKRDNKSGVGRPFSSTEENLELRKLLQRLLDVCEAMDYAHSRGVLHRDLKPGNIMLGKYGETLVVDWGLAKPLGKTSDVHLPESPATATTIGLSSLPEPALSPTSSGSDPTVMGSALGTLAYMSPEQAQGRLDLLSPASDVFSLGAILYQILIGQPPYEARSREELLRQAQAGEFRAPRTITPQIPRPLEAICLKAMSLRPSDRYSSAAHLAADMERYLADEPVMAFREPVSLRARRWAKRHQVLVGSTAATVLAATVALGVLAAVISGKNETLRLTNNQLDLAKTDAETKRALAEKNETHAREQSQLALQTLSSVIFDVQSSLINVPGGADVRQRLLTSILPQLDKVSTEFIAKSDVDRNTMAALVSLADTILQLGGGGSPLREEGERSGGEESSPEQNSATLTAERLFRRAHGMAKQLAQSDLHDPQNQQDLSILLQRLGDVYLKLGRTEDALARFEEEEKISRALAESDPRDPQNQDDLSIFLSRLGDVYLRLGRTEDALARFEESLEISRALAGSDPRDARKQHGLAISYIKAGDVLLKLGQTNHALARFEESLEISRALAESDPSDVQNQRELSISFERLGDVFLKLGRMDDALARFEEREKIARALAEADPRNVQKQQDLSTSFRQLGDVFLKLGRTDDALVKFEEGLKIARALAESDPSSVENQRDLAVSYECLGEVALAIGKTEDALKYFSDELIIAERRMDADPSDAEAKRFTSVVHSFLGKVYLKLGRTDDALEKFEETLKIRRALAEADPSDPEKQRDLSASYFKLGDVYLKLGKAEDALERFEDDLKISLALAKADPSDAEKQRDLALSYERLGDVFLALDRADDALAKFEDSLKIRRPLAEADPSDAQKQRDLSVSYSKLGGVYLKLGRAEEALAQFEDDLKISLALAEADPSDPEKQRDLSISYSKLGDVYLNLGRMDDALAKFEDSLKIRRPLAEADPSDVQKQRILSVAYYKLGDLFLKLGRMEEALARFEDDLKISLALAEADPGDPQKQSDLALSHDKLSEVAVQMGRFDDARLHLRAGIAILDQMIARGELVEASKEEKVVLQERLQYCADAVLALGDWEMLLKTDAKVLPRLLLLRATEMLKRGDLASAVQAADKLRELDPKNKDSLYDVACLYAQCAAFVTKDKPAPTAAEQDQQKKYLDLALACLKDAISAGWDDFDHMRQDGDLQPLRGLPEFETLFPLKKE